MGPSQQATGIILGGAAVLMWLAATAEMTSGHPGSWLASPTAWVAVVLLAGILLSQGLTGLQLAGGIAVLAGALLAQRPAPAVPRTS